MGLPPWETSDSQLFTLVTGANSGLGFAIASRLIDEFFTSPSTSPSKHLILILCTRSPLKTRFTISRLRAHLRKLVESSAWSKKQRAKAKEQGAEYRWEDQVQRVHFLGVEVDLCDLRSVYKLADKLVNGTVGSPDATTIDGGKLPHGSPGTAKAKEQGAEYRWEDQVQRVHFLGVEVDLCDLRSVYKLADKLVNGTVGSPDATTIDGGKLPHGSPGTSSYAPDIKQDRWALSQQPGSIGSQRSWGWGLSGLRIPRLDVIILSAGIGGWVGLDWPLAVKTVLFDTVEAVTWPRYKRSSRGARVKNPAGSSDTAEQPLLENQEKPDEPPLGEVFCSNVFGHYILAHELMPLLSRTASPSSKVSGKVVWDRWALSQQPGSIGSQRSWGWGLSGLRIPRLDFSIDDIQGLKSSVPYEASKRLIDLLALTSSLPSVQRLAAPFFDSHNTATAKQKPAEEEVTLVKPQIYLTQPGIFASEIMPLPALLVLIYKFVFLFARWMGSPWHPIEPYKAAVAPVWLTLTDAEALNEAEAGGLKKAKWGSATDSNGQDRVMKTEVPGWGWNGEVEETAEIQRRKGRKRDADDLTREKREEFEVLGGKCWAQMEELRKEWEGILGVKENKQ
ncbi:3-ketosteroid reductase [Diplocarpon rosae]|nr:3-ketosteroid reductase [Diplocarpon rosae]